MSNSEIRIYIAAPFFSPKQLAVVKSIEDLLDEYDVNHFSPRDGGVLMNTPGISRADKGKAIYDSNVEYLNWCTHVIAVIDDYDTGTVWEMGYAHAKEKGIFTYSSQQFGINIMLEQSILSHCQTLDELLKSMTGKYRGKHNGELT